MLRRLGDIWACLALLVLALACFARLVAQPGALIVDGARPSIDYAMADDPRGVGNDVTFLFLPHYRTITGELDQTGRLPFWDGSGFAGRPMIGNPQGGLFYPPVWLAWACRSPSALGWVTVGHLFWGGLGLYVLARRLGMGRLAATVAAGCFEASPYILAQTFEGHYPHVWAAAWYPWAFWAFLEFQAGRRRGTFALPPILALLFLTGHPQEWYYLVLALSVWAVGDAARAVWLRRQRAAIVKLVLWGGILALNFSLVALELIPDIRAQADTLTSGTMTLGQASRYTPHSENLYQLLSPFALGGPADYFGRDNYWEQMLSMGLVPLVLALIAMTRHPNRGLIAAWLTLVVVAVLFACGHRMVLFTVFYHVVPGINRFRAPARALFLASVGASVLAGLGIEAIRSGALSLESWCAWHKHAMRLVAALLLALFVGQACAWTCDTYESKRPKPPKTEQEIAAALKRKEKRHGSSTTRQVIAVPEKEDDDAKIEPHRGFLALSRLLHDGRFWFLLGGSILGVACVGHAQGRRFAAWGLGALALVEVGIYGYGLIRVTPVAQFMPPDPVSAALATADPPVAGPFRIRARDTFYTDLNASAHGFEKININDYFQIQRAADLYQTLYPLFERIAPPSPRDQMGAALRSFGDEIRQAVLDRLGVAFLVSDHVDPDERWPIVARGTWKGKTFAVHRNPTVLPRAYVVPRSYPSSANIHRMHSLLRRIDPRAAVLLKTDPLGQVRHRQKFTPAEWVPTDSDHVTVRVTTEAAGLLVIADTWVPGWTAQVNGKPMEILRGNHTQRVVPLLEGGAHEVVMTYKPPGLALGILLSGLSTLVWFGALLLGAPRNGARATAAADSRQSSVRLREGEAPSEPNHSEDQARTEPRTPKETRVREPR